MIKQLLILVSICLMLASMINGLYAVFTHPLMDFELSFRFLVSFFLLMIGIFMFTILTEKPNKKLKDRMLKND